MSLESGHRQVSIYSAESAIRSPIRLLRELFQDIVQSRKLGVALAIRDIKAQYRQSLLGILWLVGPPIFLAVMLTVARSNNLVNPGETHLPYPAFVLISVSLWQIFTASLSGPMSALQSNKGLLTKVRFPRESILIADLCKLTVTITVQTVLIAATFLWFQVPVTASLLLVPFGVAALVALGTMLGLFLAPIGMLYRDVSNSLPIATMVWLMITPIAYPYPHYPGLFATTVRLNPVSPIIVTIREMISGQALTLLPNFLLVVAITIPLLILGLVVLRVSIPLLVERWSA